MGYSEASECGSALTNWMCENKAPIVSLESPARSLTSNGSSFVKPKFIVAMGLPKQELVDDGSVELYLGDLGIPTFVYENALGHEYFSPFTDKFVVPIELV